MEKIVKKLGFLVVSVTTILLLVACGSSKDNNISGTWIAEANYGELELVVVENEFELNLNYTKQGWFSSSDETVTLMRGQVKPLMKKFEVESITSEFSEIHGSSASEEFKPEELKMTYQKSGTSLRVTIGDEDITFNKKIKGESND